MLLLSFRKSVLAVAIVLSAGNAAADPADDFVDQGREALSRMDSDAAIHSFDLALRLDPTHADAAFWRGSTLFKLKKYREAIPDFDIVVGARPAKTYFNLALFRRCVAKIEINDVAGGRQDCETVRKVAPSKERILIDEILDKVK